MRKTVYLVLAGLLAASAMAAQTGVSGHGREPQVKTVKGQVLDGAGQPLPNAIVYLKNMKTLAVKTFIAQSDGSYQFYGLSPNVDYDLYAEHKGQRSDNKTISQFDSRSNLTVHLKVPVNRK
ncbi:MAG: carboxypeptidase-like regulatory domain-containing protein [Acidobacteriia bacterium]|nr:carboxypeptidase-like regulatory domain-containing protein [Terriglobia bacterium]